MDTWKKKLIFGTSLVSALFLGPLIVFAQQQIQITGEDSSANSRVIRVDSDGRLVDAAHGACTETTMNVGTTGVACPTTARSDRRTIGIQLIQTGETMTITTDGSTAATATAGWRIGNAEVFSDDLLGTVNANCRCTAATCSVRIKECP